MSSCWSIHQNVCALVLPVASVKRSLECTDSWLAVGEDLQVVTSSSKLGYKLFNVAMAVVAARRVQDTLTELLEKLQQPLTPEIVGEL